jgi:hypothetical protein
MIGDDLGKVVVREVCRRAVVARDPRAERAVGDEGLVPRAALRLGVVVRAVAAGKQA